MLIWGMTDMPKGWEWGGCYHRATGLPFMQPLKMVSSGPQPILQLNCLFYCSWVVRVLYIFWILAPYQRYCLQISFPIWLVAFLFGWWFPLPCKSFLVWCSPVHLCLVLFSNKFNLKNNISKYLIIFTYCSYSYTALIHTMSHGSIWKNTSICPPWRCRPSSTPGWGGRLNALHTKPHTLCSSWAPRSPVSHPAQFCAAESLTLVPSWEAVITKNFSP